MERDRKGARDLQLMRLAADCDYVFAHGDEDTARARDLLDKVESWLESRPLKYHSAAEKAPLRNVLNKYCFYGLANLV